jgi:hypothetical protein
MVVIAQNQEDTGEGKILSGKIIEEEKSMGRQRGRVDGLEAQPFGLHLS